jgi:3-phenylpropionate/cinnamic acid dioxygenase small subunit
VPGAIVGPDAVRKLYERTNRVHDDGTTRTRHVNSNVITDIDDDAGRASARSSFVVFQQTPALPLQPIVSGRYRDDFVFADGAWRFDTRHIVVDHVGDVREHLTFDLSGFQAEH